MVVHCCIHKTFVSNFLKKRKKKKHQKSGTKFNHMEHSIDRQYIIAAEIEAAIIAAITTAL